MKKNLLVLFLVASIVPVKAQLLDRVRNRVEQKVGQKIDQKIDQTIDKATQKKEPKAAPAPTNPTPEPSASTSNPAPTQVESTSSQPASPKSATPIQDFNAYSKFDFIPGEKIIAYEDFAEDAVGDFPANWNTRSSAEVVTIANREGKWLRMAQSGSFYPEHIIGDFPENFTLQVELLASKQVANIGQWMVSFLHTKGVDDIFKKGASTSENDTPNFKLSLQPGSSKGDMYYSTNLIKSNFKSGLPEFHVPVKSSVKISIWRQNQRIRVYLDSTKVLDLPRALEPKAVLNTLVFTASNPEYSDKEGAFFMGNIRMAVGTPNLRNQLSSEGKFSTTGILFDVNSDQIKPQSFGSLQSIAQLLKEDGALRVRIVGHTDADGADAANLELSKRRAASIKQALSTHFGIDASRMESDGKGKMEPVDSNNTAAGKANNRRVEFLKI
jgi:OOP family OmpA-OmpF porin